MSPVTSVKNALQHAPRRVSDDGDLTIRRGGPFPAGDLDHVLKR